MLSYLNRRIIHGKLCFIIFNHLWLGGATQAFLCESNRGEERPLGGDTPSQDPPPAQSSGCCLRLLAPGGGREQVGPSAVVHWRGTTWDLAEGSHWEVVDCFPLHVEWYNAAVHDLRSGCIKKTHICMSCLFEGSSNRLLIFLRTKYSDETRKKDKIRSSFMIWLCFKGVTPSLTDPVFKVLGSLYLFSTTFTETYTDIFLEIGQMTRKWLVHVELHKFPNASIFCSIFL